MQDDRAGPDDNASTNTHALDNRRTDPDVTLLADHNTAREMCARRNMGVVPDLDIVVEYSSGVDDDIGTDPGTRIHDRTGEHHTCRADRRTGRNHGRGMADDG